MGVITGALCLLNLALPAQQNGWPPVAAKPSSGAVQPGPRSRPTAVRPASAGPVSATPSQLGRPQRQAISDFQDAQTAVRPSVRRSAPRPAPGGGGSTPASRRPESTLRAIFEAVGYPSEMRELGGVIARAQLTVFNHRGGVLADLSLTHWADLAAVPSRDRLEFGGPPSVSRVYGRDGGNVFAENYGMAWQQFEQRAAEELEVFGLLLRCPWGFAADGFVAEPPVTVAIGNARKTRIRVRRRPTRVGNGTGTTTPTDYFDLFCDPRRSVPEQVQMTLVGGGGTVSVLLLDYFALGSVSIPRRRIFLGPAGKKVMEVRIVEMVQLQQMPRSRFRPRR